MGRERKTERTVLGDRGRDRSIRADVHWERERKDLKNRGSSKTLSKKQELGGRVSSFPSHQQALLPAPRTIMERSRQ